jgi:thymidylate synthase (FAD)
MITATLLAHMGNDLDVVNAAKVSFAKESKEFDDNSVRLIKYLAKHRHMSPFGHCFARFHVKAPIFVARQLVKHKFLRWNEVSRRYVDDEPEFYTPDVWRGRAEDKKQGSSDEVIETLHWIRKDHDLSMEGHTEYYNVMDTPNSWTARVYEEAIELYQGMLNSGVAPEQARMVLPQSTMTEWWWSGSLDAFADMCNLRCKPDTQIETRIVANEISNHMRELFPVSWRALRGL